MGSALLSFAESQQHLFSQSRDVLPPKSVREFPALRSGDEASWFRRQWQEKHLLGGVVMTVFDAVLPQDFHLEFTKSNPMIDFGFFLEGSFVNRVDSLEHNGLELHNHAGEYGMGYIPEMNGAMHVSTNRKIRIMHVHVLPATLNALLGDDANRVPPCLLKVLEGAADGFVHRRRQSPLVQSVANELFYSVTNGVGINMYLEGKVLELLSLVLTEGGAAGSEPSLCPKLRDTLHAIQAELEEQYAAPPTLAELSTRYHMPIANIQAGFKTLFGMSVFAFVKEYKLQRARQLFVEGDMNVSEVAWEIGYTNLSHFSSAYKKRFGVLPKAYLQSLRESLHTPSKAAR